MDVYRALSNLVENATSESLNAPDMNAMREVSEIVRSRTDMPKEAIKQIHNRLMKKDKKVTMLSLELLEYLSYTCEMTLYNQIATREFMMRIGALLKSHDSDDLVKKRICCLIKCWREIFHKDLQILFFQFYDNVIQKGFEIPSNYNSPYSNLKGGVGSGSGSSNTFQNKPASTGSSFGNSAPTSQNKPSNTGNNNQKLSGPKQQLKTDLENIKQNITLVNEMIDNQDPRGNVDQNSALQDLIQVLKTSEKNMQGLIEQLAAENDESLLELSLQLNDDIQATFERHQSLKRHMKPKPFRGRAVEEEVMQQIQNLEIGTKPQQQASSASIFSDTANALSQGLAKAQNKIPPPQNFQPPQGFNPPQQQQQQQPPKQTNILDLFDDDEPPISIPQKQNVQQQPPQQSGNLVDMFDNNNQVNQPPVNNNFNNNQNNTFNNQPPVNNNQFNQPPVNNNQFNQPPINNNNFNQPPQNNQFNQPPANNFNNQQQPPNNNFATTLGSLYNQSAQNNNNQQNSQAGKYSAFSTMSNPPPNNMQGMNMGYNNQNMQNMGQYNTNPNMGGGYGGMNTGINNMGGNMNNNPMGGMGGGYNTNANMGGGYNTNANMGGYGMGMNNNNPTGGFNNNMNMGGYGGANTFNPPPISGGFNSGLPSSNAPKKDAFDDLDEFSITTTSTKPPVQQQPQQQQQQQPVQTNTQSVDFDLF